MSRGPGRVQRLVLDALARHQQQHHPLTAEERATWRPMHDLVVDVFGNEPTTANVESVRRAVRTLTARGAVEVERWWYQDVDEYHDPRWNRRRRRGRWVPCARVPAATADEAEQWERRAAAQRQRVLAQVETRFAT